MAATAFEMVQLERAKYDLRAHPLVEVFFKSNAERGQVCYLRNVSGDRNQDAARVLRVCTGSGGESAPFILSGVRAELPYGGGFYCVDSLAFRSGEVLYVRIVPNPGDEWQEHTIARIRAAW